MSTGLRPYARSELRLQDKLADLHWTLILLLALTASVGFMMLYSVADGRVDPWALRQMIRFGVGLALMIVIACVDIRHWLRFAYAAYGVSLIGLIGVELMGVTGMGAQRWIDLGFFQLQPSELMKIALVLALARYYHNVPIEEVSWPSRLVVPLALIGMPVLITLRQPDLGTAVLILAGGAAVLFAAGVAWRYFLGAGLLVLAAIPIGWQFLHDYQRNRVLTFLDPERDPLGTGYHILQSKIAMGSGGLFGRGFMGGTQAHLNFLPEKHTDFIFTMLTEEFGMVGGLTLLFFYALILVISFSVAISSRNHFGRLLATGIAVTFFLYILVNTAMVMGLMPVVGVPLPLVSYGGTAMLTLMIAFGLVMSVHIHRNTEIASQD